MGSTSPNEFRSGQVNGVGQHGFVIAAEIED